MLRRFYEDLNLIQVDRPPVIWYLISSSFWFPLHISALRDRLTLWRQNVCDTGFISGRRLSNNSDVGSLVQVGKHVSTRGESSRRAWVALIVAMQLTRNGRDMHCRGCETGHSTPYTSDMISISMHTARSGAVWVGLAGERFAHRQFERGIVFQTGP